jgi:osmotically-inducible protein OsmY
MSTRYNDRDDRDEHDYGRRRESEYGRSYGERSQGRTGLRDENERYASESRWRGQYGGSSSSGRGRDYEGGREEGWESNRDYTSDRDRSYGAYGQNYYGGGSSSYGQDWGSGYGQGQGSSNYGQGSSRYGQGSSNYGQGSSSYGQGSSNYGQGSRSYGQSNYGQGSAGQRRFGESSSNYSQRYDYPSDSPSRGMYGNQGGRSFDYDRSRYGRGQERGYEYESDRSGSGGERGWWDRASDTVASWFGDEEAERRRRMDEQRDQYRGKGPKGYRRSDERIKEDVNDRLSEGYLDASDVEVTVTNAEVTLTGTVNSRMDKRRVEDIAESVSGVSNVENRLRVKQSGSERYGSTMGTTSTQATSPTSASSEAAGSGTTTTTPTSTSSAAAGSGSGTTGTGRTRS